MKPPPKEILCMLYYPVWDLGCGRERFVLATSGVGPIPTYVRTVLVYLECVTGGGSRQIEL